MTAIIRSSIGLLSVAITSMFQACSEHPGRPDRLGCTDCLVPAFKIMMVDSSGNKLTGFTVTFINDVMYTATVNDTNSIYFKVDSSYSIFGRGGMYTIKITHDNYNPVLLEGVESTVNRCGENNPRTLKIIPTKKTVSKKSAAGYTIFEDFTEPGCGS